MNALMEKLSKHFSLPEELGKDTPRLTLAGAAQVRIENPKCLLSYAPELIELGCGKLRYRLRGEAMLLRGMDREELLIEGTIRAVEVEGG